MQIPHPYRCSAAFRAQHVRPERLLPGVSTKEAGTHPSLRFIETEYAGVATQDIAERNRRLSHFERLIADWYLDGENVTVLRTDGTEGAAPETKIEIDCVPASVSYFEFEPRCAIDLVWQSQGRLEGFYVREIVADGKFCAEITFVCGEPAWEAMGTCAYVDAMEVGARISVGVIPLHEEIELATAGDFFDGDPVLSQEPTLLRAIAMAGELLHAGRRVSPAARGSIRQMS